MNASENTHTPGVRDDHREEMRLNTAISRVLTVGLVTAVTLLVIGAVLAIARPGVAVPHVTSVKDIPGELAALRPGGFFELGLLVLLATPFARVLALGVAFARRRWWLFAGISAVVAAMLILGAALGVSLG
jgi:uncharacterized membrane protein